MSFFFSIMSLVKDKAVEVSSIRKEGVAVDNSSIYDKDLSRHLFLKNIASSRTSKLKIKTNQVLNDQNLNSPVKA